MSSERFVIWCDQKIVVRDGQLYWKDRTGATTPLYMSDCLSDYHVTVSELREFFDVISPLLERN